MPIVDDSFGQKMPVAFFSASARFSASFFASPAVAPP